MRAMTMTLVAVLVVGLLAALSAPAVADPMPQPELPDALNGFAGVLIGKVVTVWDRGFLLEVSEVKSVWPHSTASNPQAAVGKKLLINVKWEQDGNGGWRPVPDQTKWVGSLKVNQKVAADVRNVEGQRLHIMDDPAEREARNRGLNGDGNGNAGGLPDGFKGFAGRIKGVIVKVLGNDGFVIRVESASPWRNNKAANVNAANGKELTVLHGWTKGEDGKWSPNRNHVNFILTLRAEQRIEIDVKNDEGERLHITELNEEQRKAAAAQAKQREREEKERREREEKERDR